MANLTDTGKSGIALRGQNLSVDKDGMVNLTDLHRIAGSPANRDPRQWSRKEGADFVSFVRENLNVPEKHIYRGERGRGGATYAHWQIALAYAKYLSPELHAEVNETYRQAKAEEANPQLSVDKAVANWRKQGRSDKWIAARMQGKAARLHFTDTLARHGVTGHGYKGCTDAIYAPLLGGTAEQVREQRGYPVKANLREHLPLRALTAIAFAEQLAEERIEEQKAYGNDSCIHICNQAAQTVRAAANQFRKGGQP